MLTVYSKNNCQYCVQAKALLSSKNVPFQEIKIDSQPEAREFIISQGHRTVPQIYRGNSLFVEGGYQGLTKLSDSELKERLSH